MNLKDLLPKSLPFLKSAPAQEFYFALNIGSDSLTASVWDISGKNLQIVNISDVKVGGDDDLIEAATKALDDAVRDFPIDPDKILFGVPDSWFLDDNLKDSHLNFLKHLVKELDVNPMAYVSSTHAVSHLLQKQTGIPTSAVLVGVADPLVVTIVKAGKILGTKTIKRTEDLPRDIEKALNHFPDIEVLPSKIVLYGEGNLEKAREEVLSFNWMGSLPFLHLPKIDILEKDVAVKAVSLAGAEELNPDIVYPHQGIIPTPVAIDRSERRSRPVTERPGSEDQRLVPRSAAMPVAVATQEVEQKIGAVTDSLKKRASVPLGFLKGKGFNVKLPVVGGRQLNTKVLAPIAVLILLLLGYIFLARATVTIFIDPKILEKDAQVVADPNTTSVDEASKTIPGKIIETDIEGTQKGTATGTKQIGDPAKGTILIYNKTSSVKSFPSGTVLLGPNNLKFTLDANIDNVATPSADDGTWGSAHGSVTASQIGPDSNLAQGTQLTVSGYATSDFSAKVDNAFSGGTSKDVTVVTSDDQKKLLASLASTLRNQAQSKLQDKLTGDEKILPEALDEQIQNTNYSKKVGDQASDFTLDLTVHYKGTAYSDLDLKTMVGKLVETTVPDGYVLDLSETQTQSDVSKLESDGKLVFLARFKADLLPKLDQDKIKSQIKGKSPSQAAQIIQSYDNVIGSDIKVNPSLPGPLGVIPFFARNIDIKVTTK